MVFARIFSRTYSVVEKLASDKTLFLHSVLLESAIEIVTDVFSRFREKTTASHTRWIFRGNIIIMNPRSNDNNIITRIDIWVLSGW